MIFFWFFFHNFVFHNSFWNQTFRWLSISKIFSIMGTKKSWLSQTSLPSTKCWPSRSILSMGMFTTIQSTHSGLNFTKILRKVHRILLGRALFEFCWIIRNQNNQTKQSNKLWEGQLKASFINGLARYKFVWIVSIN